MFRRPRPVALLAYLAPSSTSSIRALARAALDSSPRIPLGSSRKHRSNTCEYQRFAHDVNSLTRRRRQSRVHTILRVGEILLVACFLAKERLTLSCVGVVEDIIGSGKVRLPGPLSHDDRSQTLTDQYAVLFRSLPFNLGGRQRLRQNQHPSGRRI